ncbi:ABC-three component system protein [Aeromonas dhakensis]|uniref:ABC-three component system protein n=1 Tax=Aeromonas dhakensis TaxID=196024 RepID=UPI0009B894BA|nr:ABC-three component system protein [Aeromonas dhakensis]MBL0601286.1 hypothetical protein [Aeromonas dhakensis]MBL0658257.1 hypothetical protein [Aeromonas dhakensis]
MAKPLATIMTWDDETWEEFIHDWLIECHAKDYIYHERLGGAGDKGRDIVGYKTNPNISGYTWHNYQCKFYNDRLSYSDVASEFGKLIFFSKRGDFPPPERYYFVAPKDLSTKFSELLKNTSELKTRILDSWDKSISKKITTSETVPLTADLKTYINNFDFTIFHSIPLSKILMEISRTPLYYKYLGELYIAREAPKVTPEYNHELESVYVGQLLKIYSSQLKLESLNIDHLKKPYDNHFKGCRNDFYFASSLSRYIRDSFEEDNFSILKTYIRSSIESVLYDFYNSPFERCNKILNQASLTAISHPILTKICEVPDKKGICHHLINDGDLEWVSEDQ